MVSGGECKRSAVGGLGVLEHFPLEIPDHHAVGIVAEDVIWVHGHLAAAAGGIDHILRHGVAGGVAAQLLHDLQPAPHAGAQMRTAVDEVALINIQWPHATHQQLLHECFHDNGIVVHTLEQHGLVAQRNAGIGQAREAVAHFGGEFARMIGVHTDEERMKLLEHSSTARA